MPPISIPIPIPGRIGIGIELQFQFWNWIDPNPATCPHNTLHISSCYNNEQTTKQTKAINNSYIHISCTCDTNRAGHFTLDAHASRPVACIPLGACGHPSATNDHHLWSFHKGNLRRSPQHTQQIDPIQWRFGWTRANFLSKLAAVRWLVHSVLTDIPSFDFFVRPIHQNKRHGIAGLNKTSDVFLLSQNLVSKFNITCTCITQVLSVILKKRWPCT